MKKPSLFAVLSLIFILLGCGAPEKPASSGPVLSTVGMLTDIVRRVGEGVVEVEGLMGSGVDPHLYKPTSADVKRIQSASAVLYAGLHLEGKLQPIFERQREQGRRMEALSSRIPEHLLLSDAQGQHDPHVWMDPSLWSHVAGKVASLFQSWYPEHEARIASNALALRDELERLDLYVRFLVSSIPEEHRVLITAHDAFGYFGRRYGLEVLGIQGFSTESEAGLRRLNELVDMIVRRNLPAVFVESTVADKNVRALLEGAVTKGHVVKMGGELYSDAMGEEGSLAGTYVGMILHNAETITRALGGNVPEGGFASWKGAANE